MIKSNLSIQQGWSEKIRKEFIPFIMSWLQHMAHKKGQYVIVAYWKEQKKSTFTSLMKLCHNHKDQLCNKNTSTHPSGAHYTIIVWLGSKKTNSFTARPWDTQPLCARTLGISTWFLIGSRTLDTQGLLAKISVSRKFSYLEYFILN